METRLPRNASHVCAAAAAENSVFVMGADFSGKVRFTMMDNKFVLLNGFFLEGVVLVWIPYQPPQQVFLS